MEAKYFFNKPKSNKNSYLAQIKNLLRSYGAVKNEYVQTQLHRAVLKIEL
jgi:mannitol/fructose-specific phosphotransferase system IIA component